MDSSSSHDDIESLRSRIGELRDVHMNSQEDSLIDSSQLCADYALELESKMDQLMSDTLDITSLSMQHLEEFSEQLKKELSAVETESTEIETEIEQLSTRYFQDSGTFNCGIEGLDGSLSFIEQQALYRSDCGPQVDYSALGKDDDNTLVACEGSNIKVLELSQQIEKEKLTLKTMEALDYRLKRLEAIKRIEEAFSGLKVVEYDGNCLKLSVTTYIPSLESILCPEKVEDLNEPSKQFHELLIELLDGTMELKSAEIFPSDVYIGEIVDVAKSFRHIYPTFLALDGRPSMEWFLRRVQDRILICTLRRSVVKYANKSRHSFEYLDRDEIILGHMVGGIDAFIKIGQGWPVSSVALSLLTLKNSSNYSREISLSFLCKVVDVANSLDEQRRRDVSSFADSIEEILLQQMRTESQPDSAINQ